MLKYLIQVIQKLQKTMNSPVNVVYIIYKKENKGIQVGFGFVLFG